MSLNGWHPGERIVRRKLNYDKDPSLRMLYSHISGDLDPHHAIFHSNNLPFLPITTLDADGRPWGSILSAENGKPGFINHPRYSTLTAHARIWDGDPLKGNADAFFDGDKGLPKEQDMLVAGIGIEFPTRRRNKFAGKISRLQRIGEVFDMEFSVNESIGYVSLYYILHWSD
jgi:predicted pyridoxine 5'-phosphate oxidase superfamily flavin-nucleotide-binding protein